MDASEQLLQQIVDRLTRVEDLLISSLQRAAAAETRLDAAEADVKQIRKENRGARKWRAIAALASAATAGLGSYMKLHK